MRKEYGDLEMNLEIVDDIHEAVGHINKHGSSHTDSIVTNNRKNHYFCTTFSDSFTCGIGAKKSPMAQTFERCAPLWRIVLPVRKTVFRVLSRES